MGKWIKTSFPGVRYREHPTRKHGVKPDRYFTIRYKLNGRDKEEGLGWASQDMTEKKAGARRSELTENQRIGQGPRTLQERRKRKRERIEREQAEKERLDRDRLTFLEFFEQEYFSGAQETKKPETMRKEKEHVKNWIGPVLGKLPLKDIRLLHLEKIRSNLVKATRTPRTMQYIFRTFSIVWNHARDMGYVHERSPSKALKLPRVSNTRERYLSRHEAVLLLEKLKSRNPKLHDISLLSLETGMRFSEITGLAWGCVDLEKGEIRVLKAKQDKTRTVYMTSAVKEMFSGMARGLHNELIFKNTQGGRIGKITKTFDKVVLDLGLNDNVTESTQKFTFHCLRHSFASRLVQAGTDLYLIQKLLGHSTPVVTQRYSHIANHQLRDAVNALDRHSEHHGVKVVKLNVTH